MENRIQRLFLIVLLLAAATPGRADTLSQDGNDDQVIQPELQRRDVQVPHIDSENVEAGLYYGVLSIQDFGSHGVWGGTLAYHVTEDLFLEAEYGSSKGGKTSFEKLSGGAQLLNSGDRKYSYYNVSVGWNVLPGEVFVGSKYAFPSSFYLIGGIGGTRFAGDSAFTVDLGAGYRLLLTDWLALHIDARDYIFDRSIFGSQDRSNNLELRTGFTVFF